MNQPSQNQFKACNLIAQTVLDVITVNGAIHTETAVSSCARLAGTFYFRSFNLPTKDIQEGSVLLSEEANDKGPELIQYLSAALVELGVEIDYTKSNDGIPNKNVSHLSTIESQSKLELKLKKITVKFNLSNVESGQACALATAIIIERAKEALSPDISFKIAALGFVEGTKTVPPAINEKPWYKVW